MFTDERYSAKSRKFRTREFFMLSGRFEMFQIEERTISNV